MLLSTRLLAGTSRPALANRNRKTYLFPGKGAHPNGDLPLHPKAWDAVHQAAGRAGLDKRVHPHTLRHCFATRTPTGATRTTTCSAMPWLDLKTTSYLHLSERYLKAGCQPLDSLTLAAPRIRKMPATGSE